jgi:hypothetical protein
MKLSIYAAAIAVATLFCTDANAQPAFTNPYVYGPGAPYEGKTRDWWGTTGSYGNWNRGTTAGWTTGGQQWWNSNPSHYAVTNPTHYSRTNPTHYSHTNGTHYSHTNGTYWSHTNPTWYSYTAPTYYHYEAPTYDFNVNVNTSITTGGFARPPYYETYPSLVGTKYYNGEQASIYYDNVAGAAGAKRWNWWDDGNCAGLRMTFDNGGKKDETKSPPTRSQRTELVKNVDGDVKVYGGKTPGLKSVD